MKRLTLIIPMVALVLELSAVSCGGKVAPPPNKVIPLSENHYNKGTEYVEDGRYEIAVQEFNKAIQLDPDYALAYYNRGVSYHYLGQYASAAADKAKAWHFDSKYC